MTLSVTYSCRAALARTPACPRPPRGPPPRCPPTPARGAPRTLRARPAPARTKLEPAATRAPRGLHARLDSGPAGSATGDWPAPALPASYLPQLGRHPGEGALPASRRTPGSPGPSARRGALARARVNPFAAASRRPHPRSTPPPPPRLPQALHPQALLRCPAPSPGPRHCAGAPLSLPPHPAVGGGGGLPGDWKLGRATSPPRGPAEHRGEPARQGTPPIPPPASPYTLWPRRLPPRISAVEAGFDPVMERGCRPEIGAGGPSGRRACGEHPGAGAGAGLGAAIGAGFLGFHPDSPSALPADSVLLGDHVTRAAFDPSLGAGRGRGREGVSDAGPTRARGGCRESRRR